MASVEVIYAVDSKIWYWYYLSKYDIGLFATIAQFRMVLDEEQAIKNHDSQN